VVLAPADVEDCYYTAIEAARIAKEYSVPVFILSDQSLATRIEAFNEPDLDALMVPTQLDLAPRGSDFKPYPLEGVTRHAPPGVPMTGPYPTVTGLEHDEGGHPTGNPVLHMKMTAKRREKIKQLAATLPRPDVFGDTE